MAMSAIPITSPKRTAARYQLKRREGRLNCEQDDAVEPPPRPCLSPTLAKIEAIEVHHLGPRGHEIFHELLLRVGARINLRECAQLCVRAEDQVGAGARPFGGLGLAIAAFIGVVARRLPFGVHAEQVDEEVIRQRSDLLREDAML